MPSRPPVVPFSRIRRAAAERFGITAFREGQRALIEAALEGRSALGVLPTGAGKSLCFQLPALFLPKATVVVSPLIALMQDQHERLVEADVASARVDSTLRAGEEREVEGDIREGRHEVLFVTPERLEKPEFLALLREKGVSLLVVDEAHCISQWGHDFRPAFLGIRAAREALGNPPVLALTATATPEVARDVLTLLGIPDAEVVRTGLERPNLFFEVARTPTEESKRERVRAELDALSGVGLVYVATVRAAEELTEWLRTFEPRVERYHGKLRARERADIQHGFMADAYRLVVATNAFGLGIDKPDLRLVMHWNFPGSLEAYYQEAGRAGRDGSPARAVLLYQLEDRRIQAFFLGGKGPRRDEAAAVFHALVDATAAGTSVRMADLVAHTDVPERRVRVAVAELEAAGAIRRRRGVLTPASGVEGSAALEALLETHAQRQADDREKLEAMMRYAQGTECRMRTFRRYFGEDEGEDCGHCDTCRARAEGRPLTEAPAAPAPRRRRRRSPASAPRLAPDQRVVHAQLGPGWLRVVRGAVATVQLDSGGDKVVQTRALVPADAAPSPAEPGLAATPDAAPPVSVEEPAAATP